MYLLCVSCDRKEFVGLLSRDLMGHTHAAILSPRPTQHYYSDTAVSIAVLFFASCH